MDMDTNCTLILQGVLWLNRDRIFCRWKERNFILVASYLLCFKKKPTNVKDMGTLLFKVCRISYAQ